MVDFRGIMLYNVSINMKEVVIMRLYTTPCLNPYIVDVSNKQHRINSISVFNESGVISRNPFGWFGSNNNYPDMEIPCDCVRKLKFNASCETAFIVKNNDTSAMYGLYGPVYDLFIPDSVLKLGEAVYEKVYFDTMIQKTMRSTVVKGAVFEDFKTIESNLPVLRSEISSIGVAIKNMHRDYSELSGYCAKLIELQAQYVAEEKRISSLSIEELKF